MAKKPKRKVSAVKAPVSIPEIADVQVAETPVVASRPFGRRVTAAPEFNPDYSYIVKDLKRIGMLAGSFFVILVILSFIIK